MYAKRYSLLLVVLMLAACSLGQEAKRPGHVYDFGIPAQAAKPTAKLAGNLLIAEVHAPTWLDTPAMLYRLAYHDAAQLHAYADSRWAAAPAALLSLRLRQTQSDALGSEARFQIQLELEEFSQVFDSKDNSRGVLRVRATLMRSGERNKLASHTFNIERKAPSADASGAVQALTEAADALVGEIQTWLQQQGVTEIKH